MATRAALERWLARIGYVASAALFALMLVVFVSVGLRFLFNSPLKDQFDLSRMFLGVAVLWGIAAACASDEYVRGDILWDKLPPTARKLVDLFGRSVILAAIAVLSWQVFFKVTDVVKSGELTSELRLVIWPFYAVMFMGSLLAVVGVLARLAGAVVTPAHEMQLAEPGSPVTRAAVEEG
jgi:TRAP-type C4-dicarboxylate transport system permease small subunit